MTLRIPDAKELMELANGTTTEVDCIEVPAAVYQDIIDAILNDPVLKEAADEFEARGRAA